MMRCRLNTAALGLLFATALAVTPALSAPNTTNQMLDAETCKALKTQLRGDILSKIATFGWLVAAEERGDAEEVWRLKRKLYSARIPQMGYQFNALRGRFCYKNQCDTNTTTSQPRVTRRVNQIAARFGLFSTAA